MNTFLFDLDGTLLPMDQEQFINEYFTQLGAKAASLGYNPKEVVKAVWAGTKAMVENDGTMLNHDRFWKTFASLLGPSAYELEPEFDAFYSHEFNNIKKVVASSPYPRQIVQCLRSKGYRLLLATNPLFPAVGTESRIRWAGLNPEDFECITTYENICYCKPNPDYYRTLLETYSLSAEEVMMVGNDVKEDILPASLLGMHTYLVMDWMIPFSGPSPKPDYQGSLKDLLDYIQTLPPPAASN